MVDDNFSLKNRITHRGIEGLGYVLSMAFEAKKMVSRGQNPTAERSQVVDYLLSHSGDFVDGYLGAMLVSVGVEVLSSKVVKNTSGSSRTNQLADLVSKSFKTDLFAAAVSSSVVVYAETHDFVGTPDVNDIPMGLAGVIAYLGVRALTKKYV